MSSPRQTSERSQRFAIDLPNLGNLMVTSWAAQNREEAMMLRIIHGKLKPRTWDSYERLQGYHGESWQDPGIEGTLAGPR